jgi:hypothetical protein
VVSIIPCHHGTALNPVEGGGNGLQVWAVAAYILNNQSRTDDKEWSFSLGVGSGVKFWP